MSIHLSASDVSILSFIDDTSIVELDEVEESREELHTRQFRVPFVGLHHILSFSVLEDAFHLFLLDNFRVPREVGCGAWGLENRSWSQLFILMMGFLMLLGIHSN
jgi:hypothetical protein